MFLPFSFPIGSMYGIYANIGGILMVNVTIYSIHGSYGFHKKNCESKNKDWDLTNMIPYKQDMLPTSAHPIHSSHQGQGRSAAGVPTERPLLGGCGSSTRTGCCRFRLREGV